MIFGLWKNFESKNERFFLIGDYLIKMYKSNQRCSNPSTTKKSKILIQNKNKQNDIEIKTPKIPQKQEDLPKTHRSPRN